MGDSTDVHSYTVTILSIKIVKMAVVMSLAAPPPPDPWMLLTGC